MSSTLLYLAIVAVWAVVLVPMWLRRDSEAPANGGLTRLISRRPAHESDEEYYFDDAPTLDHTPDTEDLSPRPADLPPPLRSPRPAPSIRRAAIIARRRRRTAALILLTLTALLTALLTAAPWWITLPPTALFTAHLALLRTATKIDQSRRATPTLTAAEPLTEADDDPPTPSAEIITFTTPTQEVFDQYAEDPPRAVGD